MLKRTVSGVTLTLLLIGMLTLAFNVQPVKASGTIYIRVDGSVDPPAAPISSVDNVTYTFTDNIYDEIVVERDNIVVDGAGYTVQGTESGKGINLSDRSNVTIQNMEIKAFYYGIYLYQCSNSSVFGNNITNNGDGIWLRYSRNNAISGNTITANDGDGILLDWSPNNTLRNNDASNNEYNFGVYGLSLSHYFQDIDDSNTVNGKPVYYWVNRRDLTVPFDAGYVALVNCTNITVQNLNLTNNRQGILLAFTTNSTITKNNITNNEYGIWLDWSSNYNTVSGNTIANNEYGIWLDYSSNNIISGNNITNNGYGIQLWDYSNYNTVSGNNITNNEYGIYLGATLHNIISGNNITGNNVYGMNLFVSSYNTLFGNNITNNGDGIQFFQSSENTISGNNITNNGDGIWLDHSSNNIIYHNNFVDNTEQVYSHGSRNVWDDGYPSGGNYWSDYVGVDVKSGPDQDLHGSDGIGDTSYVIDANNVDHYPLMNPYGAPPPPAYALTITTTIGGTTDPPPGIYSYTTNSSIQVTAIPNLNFLFHHWELNDVDVGSANPYVVGMDKDHILKAIFSPVPAIPVGGYSIPIKGYTTTKPLTLYLALIGILTVSFTIAKRRKKQQN